MHQRYETLIRNYFRELYKGAEIAEVSETILFDIESEFVSETSQRRIKIMISHVVMVRETDKSIF